MLKVNGLALECNGKLIVKDIDFELNTDEVMVLVGNSGSGKSVTVSSVLGLLRGDMHICGGSVSYETDGMIFRTGPSSAEALIIGAKEKGDAAYGCIRGNEISMIFQEHNSALNPFFTVQQHLEDTLLTHRKCNKENAARICREWLMKVWLDNSEEFLGKYPSQLSGGEAQRLMTALALCTGPKVLIADEPTTNLDASVQSSIMELITGFLDDTESRLMSLLLVTHDVRNIEKIIRDGRRSVKVVYFDKDGDNVGISVESRTIGTMNELFHGWDRESAVNFFRNAEEKFGRETCVSARGGKDLLEALHVCKTFRSGRGLFDFAGGNQNGSGVRAVDDVSLSIKEGEILGLVGESGSGKSTLGRMMVRLCSTDSGEFFVYPFAAGNEGRGDAGEARKEIHTIPERKFRGDFQMIFQSPDIALNSMMKTKEIMMEAVLLRQGSLPDPGAYKKIEHLLQQVGLNPDDVLHKYPFELSGGQKRRLGIARVLAIKPRFIVADEPIAEIDVTAQFGIIELLKKLRDEEALTLMVISHDFDMIKGLCDRVAVMYKSRIVEIGRTADLISMPGHPYTRALFKSNPVFRRDVSAYENGCHYLPWCSNENMNGDMSLCELESPEIRRHGDSDEHECACHFPHRSDAFRRSGCFRQGA